MSNLTKYEVLKHRHLSLLKALEEKGVTAHYSQQEGEWQITKTVADCAARFGNTGNFGGFPTLYDNPDHVVQRYSQEWWGLKVNGESIYVRDANEQVPQWVRDAERKFCAYRAEFNGFKVTVDQDNNRILYTVGNSRVPEKVVDATPVLTHLLAAISSAIVAASPAKVD